MNGLEPNEIVGIQVSYLGNPVFTTSRNADVNGTVILTLTREAGDAEGQYTLLAFRAGATRAQGTLVPHPGRATTTATANGITRCTVSSTITASPKIASPSLGNSPMAARTTGTVMAGMRSCSGGSNGAPTVGP